jgi:hypothetical protein
LLCQWSYGEYKYNFQFNGHDAFPPSFLYAGLDQSEQLNANLAEVKEFKTQAIAVMELQSKAMHHLDEQRYIAELKSLREFDVKDFKLMFKMKEDIMKYFYWVCDDKNPERRKSLPEAHEEQFRQAIHAFNASCKEWNEHQKTEPTVTPPVSTPAVVKTETESLARSAP